MRRGKAAEALGELGEARAAYERAIALEADGGDATDAPALLAALDTPPARLVLWGDDHPELGEQRVEALGDDAAAGITAGARPKGYAHVDPNEDVVAVVRGEHGTLLVCADGHNGATASRLAVEEVLRRLGDEPPPADLDDAALVSMWHAAGETIQRVTGERGHPHPESRTTLLVALIGNGRLQWAAMGDSLLALVDRNGVARRLDTPRHHFVGWPMSPTAVAQRLRRGRAELGPDEWVVLVTDGFSDFVPQPALGSIAAMAAGAPHARAVAQRLRDTALSAGAGDNVAVAVGRGRPAASRLTHADRARGCLLGVAVGDAVGAPIEFLKLGAIRATYGPRGLTELAPAYGRLGAITDDTQMTLFTAEGLIRARNRELTKGVAHTPSVVDHAYARWLATQGGRSPRWTSYEPDGWLISIPALHHRRAPGDTCLAAMHGEHAGSVERPVNDSKGCGGVMRMAPVGLVGPALDAEARFRLGCELAALTHGHPSGYLAAGAFAQIVGALCDGGALVDAVHHAVASLAAWPGHEECTAALRAAIALEGPPTPERVERLGEGWVAEEALAIGVYCALRAEQFRDGVLAAVNHSGDSDSTGAIAGALLGAMHGPEAIPTTWLESLELREVVERVAADLEDHFGAGRQADPRRSGDRYPPW